MKNEIKEEKTEIVLEQWKTCVEMANSISDKRTSSNNLFITINSALISYCSLNIDGVMIISPVLGIVICIVWWLIISNYKKLNKVKYEIINDIEKQLPCKPFSTEWEKLKKKENYKELTIKEKYIPSVFILFYLFIICNKL